MCKRCGGSGWSFRINPTPCQIGALQMHIMIDLETWGKRPGCDIRSIGAVVMNPAT